MNIVYLHGFASSPQSGKAQFFKAKFEALGIPISIPQLDQGDFESLTISGMLDVTAAAVASSPTVLMGSSLGGFVFVLSFVFNLFVDWFVGQRVSAKTELEGLDVPEMGAVAYPDFVLRPESAMAD